MHVYLYVDTQNLLFKCMCPLFSEFTFVSKIVPKSSLCIISVIKGDYAVVIHVCFIYAVISPKVNQTFLWNQSW